MSQESLVPSSDNTPPPASVPSHLSESTFRRYEAHLHYAVAAFPEARCFTPEDMHSDSGRPIAPTTFAARLRDSIASLLRYRWETTVDTEKLWSIAGKYVVSHEKNGTVWFRGKERQGRPTHLTPEARERALERGETATPEPLVAQWAGGDLDQLTALCILIHHGRISAPVHMDFNPTPGDIAALTDAYNVAIFHDTILNKTIVQ